MLFVEQGLGGDLQRGVGGRAGADVAEAALPRGAVHGGHLPVAVHVPALLFTAHPRGRQQSRW